MERPTATVFVDGLVYAERRRFAAGRRKLNVVVHAALNLGDQGIGEAQVMESLFQDRSGVLSLAAITCEALLRCAAATLSGFRVFFGLSCARGHGALLDSV
jgi:hypothetical protein